VNAVAVEASENASGDLGRVNDAEVTMIGHPASDSWNVGAVGYCVDDRGQSSRVGRVHGHCPVFRGHDRGRGCSYVRRDRRLCRVNDRGHSPFGGHSPSCLARSAWSHIVCRRDSDDTHLSLAHPSRSERDRASLCNANDSQDGMSRRKGGSAVEGMDGESADACLAEGDLGEAQIQVWVEVEEWKTFGWLVCSLAHLTLPHPTSMSGTVTVRRKLYPLASLSQIQSTPSAQDGVPHDIEEDLRAFGCKLIHQAGILLNQKQVAVATAQILLQRFFYVSSLKQFGVADIGMGALYLSSKLEECPVRMRDLINVYDILLQRAAHTVSSASSPHHSSEFKYTPMSYFCNTFYDLKEALVVSEMQILKRLGFDVQVVLPYGTLVNYMRLLGLTSRNEAVSMAWGYLNDALQTPVYALYAVPTVVSASILLTTRRLGISLPSSPESFWWELFDVEWEDLWSVCGYIMRLYRERTSAEQIEIMGLLSKKDLRQWLDGRVK